jgi:hypothetical protein
LGDGVKNPQEHVERKFSNADCTKRINLKKEKKKVVRRPTLKESA